MISETRFKKKKRKEAILIKEKVNTWKKYCHSIDICLSQCQTCDKTVKCPLQIKQYIDFNNELTSSKYYKYPIGEFGHIISEKNGGLAISKNLIIQCKKCNTTQGTKNIENPVSCKNSLMLNNESNDTHNNRYLEPMDIDSQYCLENTRKGVQCKNKACHSNGTCSIHCGM